MFEPHHHGLIFSAEQTAFTQQNHDQEPAKAAWDALGRIQPVDLLGRLHIHALRSALMKDQEAGLHGVELLQRGIDTLPEADDPVGQARISFAFMQSFELLRHHPACDAKQQSRVFDWLMQQVMVTQGRMDDLEVVGWLWSGVTLTATGIVLEREELFQQGVDLFRKAVDQAIRPEGYLKEAVDFPEVESMSNQLLAVQALSLIAEMGAQTGVNLWRYENRSVSVLTAVTYPLYYYYYPEAWPWNGDPYRPSAGIDLETAQRLFRAHAGFLELARPRYERPLRAIQMILGELRPVYDLYCGGAVTLLHGQAVRKRRRLLGWF